MFLNRASMSVNGLEENNISAGDMLVTASEAV